MLFDASEISSHLKKFVDKYFPQASKSLKPMVGDAGQRSYYRMLFNKKNYVVMHCPPSYCNVQPFIDIANYLYKKGFSAPQIIQQNVNKGFLILEDFGPVSVKDYLVQTGDKKIYTLIIDLLISVQSKESPLNLAEHDNKLLLSELNLFVDWYIPHVYNREVNIDEFEEFSEIWQNILSKQAPMPRTMVMRDYHAENLMYLDQRQSIQKLGLLDFQDALIGSPIYDLVSVLEDARIEVSRSDALKYVEYFAKKKKMDVESVLLNYHILGAQRNSRILGVFARKAMRDKDDSYLQYIPIVRKYLEYDLSHEALTPLRNWFKKWSKI